MIENVISALGMIFSIAGNLLLAKKNVLGFWSFLLGNVMWIAYSLIFNPNVSMIMQYIIFTVINIYGIYQYKKGDKNG